MSFLPGKTSPHFISFGFFVQTTKERNIKLRVCYSVFSFDENTKLLGTELYLLIQKKLRDRVPNNNCNKEPEKKTTFVFSPEI